jgi:hypothetical protein
MGFRVYGALAAGGLAFMSGALRAAATLPPHGPLRILVVGDNVNPHSLPPGQITEVEDIAATLAGPGTGLTLAADTNAVRLVPTNSIEQATPLLRLPPSDANYYSVVVYFAHRIPDNSTAADNQLRQDDFTAAMQQYLLAGGGLVAFHHASYFSTGKNGILDLVGCTANNAVPWDTVYGQDVVNVTPGHFVSSNGVAYPGNTTYADPARGVPSGTYPVINNVPDEQYPSFTINANATSEVKLLFGGKYSATDATPHLLGFTHRRQPWWGAVVGWQPAEYQPNALNVNGWQFQILANAIVYASTANITLTLAKGAGGAVTLNWSRGQGPNFFIARAAAPGNVIAIANQIATTTQRTYDDTPPAGALFYQVTEP